MPAATQQLLEMGADVIKVEPPGGESARHMGAFGAGVVRAHHRGKRSVEIDLKTDEGLDTHEVCKELED